MPTTFSRSHAPLLRCAPLVLLFACESGEGSSGGARVRASVPAATADASSETGDAAFGGPDADLVAALTPAAPRLARLTRLQYHNAIRDLFGGDIAPPSALEPDAAVEGLRAIGSTVTTLSPRGVEQAYEGAKNIADQLLAADGAVPCLPADAADRACLRQLAETLGPRIWRRPLVAAELDALVEAGARTGAALGSAHDAAKTVLVLLLASPNFLYRVEIGEPSPSAEAGGGAGARRYTSHEMASRLSFFLWNSVPDDTLRQAADRGDLVEDAALQAQVDRMLASDRLRDGLRNLIAEWFDLYALDDLSKDPNVFRHYSADLGPAAREETLRLAEHLFLTENHDFRDLFTTHTSFVNRRLAAIYNVPATVDEGFGRIELPADGARAGFLGQVAFLALNAHPTASSATRRGLAIRKHLLCQEVPSPPANLNTAIPEPSPTARTLKERLESHQANPACSGCHVFIDPPGYGLENFDGVGRFRLLDNGAEIDPSGELDGASFTGPAELNQVVADHPELLPCAVRTVYAYASGHLPERGEKAEVARLLEVFRNDGNHLRTLMGAVATSPGFRRVSTPPPDEPSTDAGEHP